MVYESEPVNQMNNSTCPLLPVQILNFRLLSFLTELVNVVEVGDSRTKTDLSRTERFGPGPRTGPANFQNLGYRTDQDQQNFENLGPIRSGRSPDLTIRESLV